MVEEVAGATVTRSGTTVVPFPATHQKLSRFPSTLVPETLLGNCSVPRTSGHCCCMTKLIGDNRVIVVLFLVLAHVNAYAITAHWYH